MPGYVWAIVAVIGVIYALVLLLAVVLIVSMWRNS